VTEDLLLAPVSFAFGALVLWIGIGFRQGFYREKGRWYFDESMPVILRNGPLISVPAGLFFVASGVLIALGTQRGALWADVAIAIVAVIWFVAGSLGVIWSFRPPEWLKPEWLRDEERRRSAAAKYEESLNLEEERRQAEEVSWNR
jgi:hypothetical protein